MTENMRHPQDYLALPKTIGEVDPDELIDIARHHQHLKDDARSLFTRAEHGKIAGSALIEAALVNQDPNHTYDDYLLNNLDTAFDLLNEAADDEWEILEQGLRDPNDQETWLRAVLATDFINVYRDMICGELTELTTDSLKDALAKKFRDVERISNTIQLHQTFRGKLLGLKSELVVLRNTWGAYRGVDDPIVIPSTYRGGNGSQRRRETHDVVFFQQDPDTTFHVTEVGEVKSRERDLLKRYRTLGRYAHVLFIVDPDGRIERME